MATSKDVAPQLTLLEELKGVAKTRIAWFLAGALLTHGDPTEVVDLLKNLFGF